MTALTPTLILDMLRNGDPEATRQFLAILVRMARRYIPSQTEAESVASEALTELISKLTSSANPDPAEFKVWTKTAVGRAARRAINRYKKAPLQFMSRMHTDEDEQRPLSTIQRASDQLARIHEVLETMPTATQEAIVATAVDGRTIESVAAELGMPASTVRNNLLRARRKFRRVLTNAEKFERLSNFARQVRLAREAASDPHSARPDLNTGRSQSEKSSTAQR
jgi:RNA polymerase sigma factor (sigma-70 family)